MRIPCQPQVWEVADRLNSARSGDDSLLRETPGHPLDLKIQEMGRMQSLTTRLDSLLYELSGDV